MAIQQCIHLWNVLQYCWNLHRYAQTLETIVVSFIFYFEIRHSNENRFLDFSKDWEVIKESGNELNLSSDRDIPTISANIFDQLLNSCDKYVIYFEKKTRENFQT